MSSLFTLAELKGFWTLAAKPVPIVIVGGGRWARVWASVIAQARDSGAGITVASRHAATQPPEWTDLLTRFPNIKIAPSASAAFDTQPGITATIVASRPQDHVRDGLEALNFGSNVLVEKPLSPSVSYGRALVETARKRGRILVLGTEFAFLPACHALHAEIAAASNDGREIRLIWNDPQSEIRHGAFKVRHTEVSLLIDLLPHAASIFRIYSGAAGLNVVGAQMSQDGSNGTIDFRDQSGRRYHLEAGSKSAARMRSLQTGKPGSGIHIDFSARQTAVLIDGKTRTLGDGVTGMDSVMRLELGAFIHEIDKRPQVGSTGAIASEILDLQAQLENILLPPESGTDPHA